ncbi:DUF3173 domain-containing protein [Carnobacterium divergens]|uniref:DUF3173 domain-containing protein n=1 Tax=Carnobacterium divergens TaxID=2748 RepID=UPI000D4A806F|nr:DUF3173 domain-containing protein [Carnobacterium divergens]MCO6016912.1 DUF3173 domain-containing protein [Carnobacterium divergens]TFI62549.1 DUF3173 domain-containing protein [Carnobacterium divergens]TFI89751.1 DUF3173 domain-containing protein [Carnobacterium divergens]TFJ04806.1 DUF3173 domain-containing protein [Carnobacterium divergens]TFJ06296.1 DUF3173 domain-containing protein [Carnobacterium divergens]
MITVTKDDLINLGFGTSQSQTIIRLAKYYMVQEGFDYYNSRRLGRVPVHAVESILGVALYTQKDVNLHGKCV